jgi:hypothetical protein
MPAILLRQPAADPYDTQVRLYDDIRTTRLAVVEEIMALPLPSDERLRAFFDAVAKNFGDAIEAWNVLQPELFGESGVYFYITPEQTRPAPKMRQAQLRERAREALRKLNAKG